MNAKELRAWQAYRRLLALDAKEVGITIERPMWNAVRNAFREGVRVGKGETEDQTQKEHR